jgi:hypothetical protein
MLMKSNRQKVEKLPNAAQKMGLVARHATRRIAAQMLQYLSRVLVPLLHHKDRMEWGHRVQGC